VRSKGGHPLAGPRRPGVVAFLETRIPPPLWFLLHAAILLLLDHLTPALRLLEPPASLWLAGLCAVAALTLDGWALTTFLWLRTSINPLHPGRARRLVTSGPYRLSRNPMYLGLLLWLLALGAWSGSPWVVPMAAAFVGVLTRLQILPEERVLAERFGTEWQAYCGRVARWL
jgi:protein-S-isoprenylcysteine O-methyltransferase Ste14